MLVSLKDFDPVVFLNINTVSLAPEELINLRQSLNTKIGEYVLLKLSDQLTPEQLEEVTNVQDGLLMLATLRKLVPDVDVKILNEVENFKKEYLETVKKDLKDG